MIDFNDKKIWFNSFKKHQREAMFKAYYPTLCYCQLNNTHIAFIYDKEHEIH